MVNKLLVLILLCSPLAVMGQADCPEHKTQNSAEHLVMHARGCPNNFGMHNICASLNAQSTEDDPESLNAYVYQTKIFEASCVLPSDSEIDKKKKVQSFWNKYGKDLACDNTAFNVRGGSIVKYAVSERFDDFIHDVSRKWQVNLNKIDSVDQRTVLDYVRDEKLASTRPADIQKLQTYYNLLKAAGAKHKSEL